MTGSRRHVVTQQKWTRLRDHLPNEDVAAGNRTAPPATVDDYKASRHFNALALEGALDALRARLVVELGSPAGAGDLVELLAAVKVDDSAAEIAAGLTPGERAAVRELAAVAAGELAVVLRRAAVRAETLEIGLRLRREDLEGDQRVDNRLSGKTAP